MSAPADDMIYSTAIRVITAMSLVFTRHSSTGRYCCSAH